MPSPLFPEFNRFLRQQNAIKRWLATEAAKAKRGGGARSGEPIRYGSSSDQNRSTTGKGWLWNSLLSKLGDIGKVIHAMLQPNGQRLAPNVEKELQAAQDLLEAFGYDIGRPGAKPTEAPQILRELVDETTQKPEEKPTPTASPDSPRRTGDRAETQPAESGESTRSQSQPEKEEAAQLASGLVQMIPVKSSNVHSIGFAWSNDGGRVGDLLVRFLGGTSKQRSGPGPLYRYIGVDRSVFLAFQRASSKGAFVWDELRVRGTVSGHQMPYELAGTGESGYVPRQAGLKRGQKGEFYMPRSFRGRRSSLPERQVKGQRGELTPGFRGKAQKMTFRGR